MRALFSVLVGVAWLLAAVPAAPHHSFAAEFDLNRPIALTGTVTRVEWTNPHAWLYIDVEGDEDNVQSWAIELLGINTLVRRGWTRDSVKPGDVVSVEGFAARDGRNAGNASLVTMPSTGERLWDSANQ
ncbi:MAG TPA: DUF6152 family protein [Gammaproteobacteria bacterium]|nr:DUF6152 family protein [Gammaproteobacteria bacterium]